MADVASAAGVSLSTVSRALSGRGDLPGETRSRIQLVARDLGYQRAATPRGRPSTSDPRMIELVLGVFDDPWTDEVVSGARSAAARLGYDLVLTAERDDPADDWPTRAAARKSGGVILGLIRPTQTQLARLRDFNIPVVLLDPRSGSHRELESVGTTDEAGGHDAGAHLADLGFVRFMVVVGDPPFRFGRAREAGFRAAVLERVPGAEIRTVRASWTDADLAAALRPVLRQTPLPIGVFACNDAMAAGVYRAAATLGLRIPQDLSVIGFDDTPLAASLAPPLTTVRQPIREMAARSVEFIRELRSGAARPGERIELPTKLIVRGSTCAAVRP
ncbi:LacI family DNA-binding transcriptional regulator [Curtobacterium sp. UNCCL20]|uniref:LacI family DNA-binding transcriptional regulator n=1 Tax=Curtobacterium sp. UNCCL20 TaxID=1502773 RepID=UPI0020C878FE|nr:LacI family DNA-binding transcriptional regulator [Curtobacterium sp. UNCCL20]